MTAMEIGSKEVHVAVARIMVEVWDKGRSHTMSATKLGRESISNSVPHMKDMGRMMMLLNIISVGVDPASNPAATPSKENMMLESSMARISQMVIWIPYVSNIPKPIIMSPPASPLMIPIMHFPKMIDVVCIGQRISSSKLEWNSLCMTIFCEDEENPEFIEDMATIPGIT